MSLCVVEMDRVHVPLFSDVPVHDYYAQERTRTCDISGKESLIGQQGPIILAAQHKYLLRVLLDFPGTLLETSFTYRLFGHTQYLSYGPYNDKIYPALFCYEQAIHRTLITEKIKTFLYGKQQGKLQVSTYLIQNDFMVIQFSIKQISTKKHILRQKLQKKN